MPRKLRYLDKALLKALNGTALERGYASHICPVLMDDLRETDNFPVVAARRKGDVILMLLRLSYYGDHGELMVSQACYEQIPWCNRSGLPAPTSKALH